MSRKAGLGPGRPQGRPPRAANQVSRKPGLEPGLGARPAPHQSSPALGKEPGLEPGLGQGRPPTRTARPWARSPALGKAGQAVSTSILFLVFFCFFFHFNSLQP